MHLGFLKSTLKCIQKKVILKGFISLQIPSIPFPLGPVCSSLLPTCFFKQHVSPNAVDFYLCSLCLVSSLTCPSPSLQPFFLLSAFYSPFIISLPRSSENIQSCWSHFKNSIRVRRTSSATLGVSPSCG